MYLPPAWLELKIPLVYLKNVAIYKVIAYK